MHDGLTITIAMLSGLSSVNWDLDFLQKKILFCLANLKRIKYSLNRDISRYWPKPKVAGKHLINQLLMNAFKISTGIQVIKKFSSLVWIQ